MAITITRPDGEPKVAPGEKLTFGGDKGPVESYTISSVNGAQFQTPVPNQAVTPQHDWSFSIQAPMTSGKYVLTVFHKSGRMASKVFNVS